MFGICCRAVPRRAVALAAACGAFGLSLVLTPPHAVAQGSHEITVTVLSFKALDKADELVKS